MHKHLLQDLAQTEKLLNNVVIEANRFLSGLNSMPAGAVLPTNIDSAEKRGCIPNPDRL